jgi:hypothetical protein
MFYLPSFILKAKKWVGCIKPNDALPLKIVNIFLIVVACEYSGLNVTSRSSTAHFVRWTVFKSRFCGFATQKNSTKSQLKNCRLARRYVGQEIKNAKLRKVRKSKSYNPERPKLWFFWLGNNVPRSLTF